VIKGSGHGSERNQAKGRFAREELLHVDNSRDRDARQPYRPTSGSAIFSLSHVPIVIYLLKEVVAGHLARRSS
jgi:hypothetical protein